MACWVAVLTVTNPVHFVPSLQLDLTYCA